MRTNREIFLQRLESVSPGLATREVLEQSSCFAFRNGRVYTFNDEIACSQEIPIDLTGAVQAKPLIDVLTRMPEDEIDVELSESELIVKGKGRRAGIRMEKDVLLPIDSVESPEGWIPLHENFADAVSIAQACASKDEAEFVLTCVHLHPDHIEACDDFQITRYPLKTGFSKSTLVRAASIKHITSLDMTEMSETPNWIHFKNPSGLIVSCRRYADNYPDLGNYLDVEGSLTALPGGIEEAVSKAEIFSSENQESKQIRVDIKDGRMRIKGTGPQGWYEEIKAVVYTGMPMSFLIDPKLLVELVKRHNECVITETRLKVDGGRFTFVTCLGKIEDKK